jgi:hypothetical protein
MSRTKPTKDADFLGWAQNISARCVENALAWKLGNGDVQELAGRVNAAKTAYDANMNPEYASHHTAAVKDAAFKAVSDFLSTYALALTVNMNISDGELEAMGLPSRVHHAHEPIEPPAESPNVALSVGEHCQVKVAASIPQEGHPSRYVKKGRYHGILLGYLVEGETEWRYEQHTRVRVTLKFEEAQAGKHVTIKAAWINPRLEAGPWCKEITVLIN